MIGGENSENEIESETDGEQEEPEEVYHCQDAEFSDFEKEKAEHCFGVNQTWALYANQDCMPRFYARVTKLLSPGFKLEITWLEPCPNKKAEQDWVDGDLPISCGRFELGDTEEVVDAQIFSHQVDCRRGKCQGTYVVYPKKGETWALFRDWDMKWGCEPERHRPPYKFVLVAIISDFREGVGVKVACLRKVKGFISIFHQLGDSKVNSSFCIPSDEMYRFSHQIPSCRMTGLERHGVPVGSFDLDPASLPRCIFEVDGQEEEKVLGYKPEPARASGDLFRPSKSESETEKRRIVCGLAAVVPFINGSNSSFQMRQNIGSRKKRCSTTFRDEIEPSRAPPRDMSKRSAKVTAGTGVDIEIAEKLMTASEGENQAQTNSSSSDSVKPKHLLATIESSAGHIAFAGMGVDIKISEKLMAASKDVNQAQTNSSSSDSSKPNHLHATIESSAGHTASEISPKRKVIHEEEINSKKQRSDDEVHLGHDNRVSNEMWGLKEELRFKEAELAMLGERIKDYKTELERTLLSLQGRQVELAEKERCLHSVEELITETNLKLEDRENQYKAVRRSVAQISVELRSNEKHLESLERSIRDSMAKEKALYYVNDEMKECCQILTFKERELKDIRKTIEAKNKVLDVKWKLLKEIKSKIALTTEELKSKEEHLKHVEDSTVKLERKLKQYQAFGTDQLLDAGNARDLQLLLGEHIRKNDILQSKISSVIQNSIEPAKLVLEAMNGFHRPASQNRDMDYDLSVTRRSCITLLEHLLEIRPWITDDVRGEAMKLAKEWKARMMMKPATSLEILGLLQLISAFGLASDFGVGEVRQLVSSGHPQQGNGSETWRSLGIMDDLAVAAGAFIVE
ncbi:unnamed protein product [Linum trigynum]|uniref:FRIGIDA-like protein n=1 Tax=Linum trigynum TaxID=586398 RepID=A0AAV2E856_9ROSI